MAPKPKRHCWECRRRCLVCDFTSPACRRCLLSGVECPGYGKVKPIRLKWLTPGRVLSQNRLNACIYRDLIPIHDLGGNPHIYPLSLEHLRMAAAAPDLLRYGMVCMVLSHRGSQTNDVQLSRLLVEKFYLYWGFAVRSLRENLDTPRSRTSDVFIAGVLTLMLTDIQQGTSLNWRNHLEAVRRLVALRGGFRVVSDSKRLRPILLVFWFVAAIGNTTCPATELAMTKLQVDVLGLLQDQYAGAVSPFQLCPLAIFAEIIRINHLRACATSFKAGKTDYLTKRAYDILQRVESFSPEEWAKSKPASENDWTLAGRVYQASVAVYCILSLQSLSIFPETPALRNQCFVNGKLLHDLLRKGFSSCTVKRFLVWSLVILGVEAVHDGNTVTRKFVSQQLQKLSHDLGTQVPLTAKIVLQSFWRSGETRWDLCFDKSYAFTTQVAVDTSQLMPFT
ncbi:C6 zinc finger domain-containing protein [Colletotrichum incanum]|nr:C6 zinc finger domain-containing protein [Colletotrichum incanum]